MSSCQRTRAQAQPQQSACITQVDASADALHVVGSVWLLRVNCVQAAKNIKHCQSETDSTICAHLIVFSWNLAKLNSFAVTAHRKCWAIKTATACRVVTTVKVPHPFLARRSLSRLVKLSTSFSIKAMSISISSVGSSAKAANQESLAGSNPATM
jgi:hypothetical protein